MLIVVMLERTIPRALKFDDDGHNFTKAKCAFSDPFDFAVINQVAIVFGLKVLAKVVNFAEPCRQSHFYVLSGHQ